MRIVPSPHPPPPQSLRVVCSCASQSASLSEKQDGVRCFRLASECLDDPLLKRLYVAREDGQKHCVEDVVVTCLIVNVLSSSFSESSVEVCKVCLPSGPKFVTRAYNRIPLYIRERR